MFYEMTSRSQNTQITNLLGLLILCVQDSIGLPLKFEVECIIPLEILLQNFLPIRLEDFFLSKCLDGPLKGLVDSR